MQCERTIFLRFFNFPFLGLFVFCDKHFGSFSEIFTRKTRFLVNFRKQHDSQLPPAYFPSSNFVKDAF